MKRLLLLTLLAAQVAQAENVKLVGTPTDQDLPTHILFREGELDHMIELKKLSPSVLAKVKAPESKTKIIEVSVPKEAIIASAKIPRGIRADCSELPVSIEGLDKIASGPGVTDIISFLKAIPKGTFQSFTFVTNSLSAQRGSGDSMVTAKMPRVLRGSIDGKITFSYTCNPASETYNQIEVFYFDEQSEEFKTKRYQFKNPAGEGPTKRVHTNPSSCVECHSASKFAGVPSLKPNWPEYFAWSDCDRTRGISFYGGNDDNMGAGIFRTRVATSKDKTQPTCENRSIDEAAHNESIKDWHEFRNKAKVDECYALLPWAKTDDGTDDGWNYSLYPYAVQSQEYNPRTNFQNYQIRTNTRFTDVYSRWMSRRIHRLMKNDVDYDRMKYYLALEGANCAMSDAETAEMQRLVPALKVERFTPAEGEMNYMHPGQYPIMWAYSKLIGMANADWQMEFKNTKAANYNTAMFGGPTEYSRDSSITEVVQGEVLKKLASESQAIAAASSDAFIAGVEGMFGKSFACIDKIAAGIKRNSKAGQICTVIREQMKTALAGMTPSTRSSAPVTPVDPGNRLEGEVSPVDKIRLEMKDKDSSVLRASVEAGRKLVQGGSANCIACHSSTPENSEFRPPNLLFVPNESLSAESQAASVAILKNRVNQGFWEHVELNVNQGLMPLGGPELSAQERAQVLDYLKSLIAK